VRWSVARNPARRSKENLLVRMRIRRGREQ